MPLAPEYPPNGGWSGELNDRQRQRQIAQHKAELEGFAQQEIPWDKFEKELRKRGWNVVPFQESWVGTETRHIRNTWDFVRDVGKGVLALLDPLGRKHELFVGKDQEN